MNKTGLIVFLVIVAILGIVIGAIIVDNNTKQAKLQSDYDNVITLIQNGEYREATIKLWSLQDKGFSDIKALEKYCSALSAYKNGDYINAKTRLESCISEIRKHKEFDDPDVLLDTIIPLAEAEREENIRRAEEEERLRKENLRKSGVPYVAMKESEINSTSLGKVDYIGHNTVKFQSRTLYYWLNSKKQTIYFAACANGSVVDVKDYRNDPWAYNPTKKFEPIEDDFDVEDYYSPEDFYEDYYDDFFDYEEAEDYYYEHGGF